MLLARGWQEPQPALEAARAAVSEQPAGSRSKQIPQHRNHMPLFSLDSELCRPILAYQDMLILP